jgi:hypothetical protein
MTQHERHKRDDALTGFAPIATIGHLTVKAPFTPTSDASSSRLGFFLNVARGPAKLVQNGTLKSYPGFPHGMPTTESDTINNDLLAWLRS